ncbi:hypothetical protein [Vibrio algicola]|uniref:Uncharacterized protein n=1 Tax=Vibrio algicola TaxID=2662262 RepID=A0A5Q0THH0_9VIBR|nr:hypothetical protein [Vibrio algicola]
MHTILKIENCEQLDELIKALTNPLQNQDLSTLDLTSLYPEITVKLDGGDDLNGQLTSTICKGLADFHNDFLKAYCIIKYSSDNLKNLKPDEREKLEIVFNVEAGCTQIFADIKECLSSIKDVITVASDGLTGNQKTALFLVAIISCGGYFAYSEYIDLQKTQASASQAVSIKEADNRQIKIWTDSLDKVVIANTKLAETKIKLSAQMDKAYQGMVKTGIAAGATNIKLSGTSSVELNEKDSKQFTTSAKKPLITSEKTYTLEINAIKRTSDGNLTVNARLDDGSENSFILAVDTTFIEQDEVNILFEAFKNGNAVNVHGNYKIRSGTIEKAQASTISKPNAPTT